ncbi:MAG TPA: Hsp20/alpha crystallin family protein [Cytophagaceae bacterium]|jgi:HSP20 family protein
MSLIKWKNNKGIEKPISSLIDSFFGRDINDFLTDWAGTQPAVNLFETKDDYRVEVAVPGMSKEDFNVKLEEDYLIVTGKKEEDKEEKDKNYMRKEFSYSSFERSFYLPSKMVDHEKIEAHYNDGILLVTVPKKEEAKKEQTARQIAIS